MGLLMWVNKMLGRKTPGDNGCVYCECNEEHLFVFEAKDGRLFTLYANNEAQAYQLLGSQGGKVYAPHGLGEEALVLPRDEVVKVDHRSPIFSFNFKVPMKVDLQGNFK